MHRFSLCFAALLGLIVASCERPEEQVEPIPPGVSVQPPREAPATGGMVVPGSPADTVEQVVDEPDTLPAEPRQ